MMTELPFYEHCLGAIAAGHASGKPTSWVRVPLAGHPKEVIDSTVKQLRQEGYAVVAGSDQIKIKPAGGSTGV
jgi:hypothetical protein